MEVSATYAHALDLADIAGAPTPRDRDLVPPPTTVVTLAGTVRDLLDDGLLAGARFHVADAFGIRVTQVIDGTDEDALRYAEDALRGRVHDLWAARADVRDDKRMAALVELYGLHVELAEATRREAA